MDAIDNQGPTTGLTPHVSYADAPAAIDFYKAAFAATEHSRMLGDDSGKIIHCHLGINGGSLMLNDDFPEMRGGAPLPAPGAVTFHLQVDDCDAWFARAVAAGATAKMAPADMFWGDRYGQVVDPFGHSWALGSPIAKD